MEEIDLMKTNLIKESINVIINFLLSAYRDRRRYYFLHQNNLLYYFFRVCDDVCSVMAVYNMIMFRFPEVLPPTYIIR